MEKFHEISINESPWFMAHRSCHGASGAALLRQFVPQILSGPEPAAVLPVPLADELLMIIGWIMEINGDEWRFMEYCFITINLQSTCNHSFDRLVYDVYGRQYDSFIMGFFLGGDWWILIGI